jgi:hypothetical protein
MSERAKRRAEYQEFRAKCREEGLRIVAETAEVRWEYTQVLDPYGFFNEIPPENYCIGTSFFARNPGSDIWVEFVDLPNETREKLWRALPAVLPELGDEVRDRAPASMSDRMMKLVVEAIDNVRFRSRADHVEAARPQDPRKTATH